MEKYLTVFAVLVALSYIYLKLAIKYKIIDKPNKRSSHTKITVRGGGILFTIAIILFFVLNNFQYPYFLLGVLAISFVSFLDDMYTLSSKIRFPFQIIAILLVLFEIGLPFSSIYMLYLIIGVGVLNMFNFMDGINGLTGFYSLVTISGLYLINLNEDIINSELIIYTFISILIFGFYNFRKKALFFAGDIGSISIGLLFFFIGFYLIYKLNSPIIMLLIAVYGSDTFLTLFYRKFFTKENVFEPHRHHIYQKIVDVFKIPHLKVSASYSLLQLIINFIVYFNYKLEVYCQYTIIVFFILFFSMIYLFLFKKLKRKLIQNVKLKG